MANGRIKDFGLATAEEVGQAGLESEVFQDVIAEIGDIVLSESAALFFSSVFAAIAPRANGIRLNYREKRFERNVMSALKVGIERIDLLDEKMNLLEQDIQEKFRGSYVECFLDNMYSERQEEKIKYHTIGFINMMEPSVTDDIMLYFMDTLNQLTIIDIDVLKMYASKDTYPDLMERYGIDDNQLKMIKAKLERNGLLDCYNDERRDENIDIIVDYLNKRVKEENKKNGSPEKIKLCRTKKVPRCDSYRISRLGLDFLKRIGEF